MAKDRKHSWVIIVFICVRCFLPPHDFNLTITFFVSVLVVHKYKVEVSFNPSEIRIASIMTKSLIERLELCVAICVPQNLFATVPSSFTTFCPHLIEKDDSFSRKRKPETINIDLNMKNSSGKRWVINTTNQRLFFPKALKYPYCADYLGTNCVGTRGEKCTYIHAIYLRAWQIIRRQEFKTI